MLTVDNLVALAKEVEHGDPIDWSGLNVSEDDAYRLIAFSILEQHENWIQNEDYEAIILSTITKLVVENFVLNLKLLENK